MRIACVHVPQFALQCVTRSDPSLRGAAVAVVSGGLPVDRDLGSRRAVLGTPIVTACSRAAWMLGVRVGMTATTARGLAPDEIRIVAADPQLERELMRGIADAVLGASKLVDTGGRVGAGGAHLAMYCEVPVKTRGGSFGDRLIELLDRLGITVRIGIADDRFTAWVAAAHGDGETMRHDESGVLVVPRGGSAAFLAPRPLSLLAISPEVQHMLEALGVRTLGEFAALPAPTVARPERLTRRSEPAMASIDYQALARGDSGHALWPYAPEAPIREEIVVGGPNGQTALSGPAAIALVSQRVALRLEGRGRGAVRVDAAAIGPAGQRVIPIADGRVLTSAGDLADALAPVLDGNPVWRLAVMITGEAVVGAAQVAESAPVSAEPIAGDRSGALADTLALALSTPGTGNLFRSLELPAELRAERRAITPGAHHRTTRQRRRARERSRELAQSRLFRTS